MMELDFLAAKSGSRLDVAIWPDGFLLLAPRPLALFTALFWGALVILLSSRKPAPPPAGYLLLATYALGATLAHAALARFKGWDVSPLVAFSHALVAGGGISAWLVPPVMEPFAAPHQIPRPVGPGPLVAVPLLLSPFFIFIDHPLAGTFLIGSAFLGLLSALFFINLGIVGSLRVKKGAVVTAAVLFTFPEVAMILLLPRLLQLASSIAPFIHRAP